MANNYSLLWSLAIAAFFLLKDRSNTDEWSCELFTLYEKHVEWSLRQLLKMATIPKAVFSSRGCSIIFYIVGHNMQFSMQHRALLFLFVGGHQGYFAGEGFDGSILHNDNGIFSHTVLSYQAGIFRNYCYSTNCSCLQDIQLLFQ